MSVTGALTLTVVDSSGDPANPNDWVTLARLNGVTAGENVSAVLDSSGNVVTLPVLVEQVLFLSDSRGPGYSNGNQLWIDQHIGAARHLCRGDLVRL